MNLPPWKIVFMGTPLFAIPSLEALIQHETVIAIYTQPDRPKGRGQKLSSSPVKEIAKKHHIHCLQPSTLHSEKLLFQFKKLEPDLAVVAAYGLFLPKGFIEIPKQRIINIHPSLLPRYRGAAPIQWSLINGDTQTGVSIIYLTPKMDSGDILLQESLPIRKEDHLESLQKKLADLSAKLLIQCIDSLKTNSIIPQKQEESQVVLAPKLTKEMGRIQWDTSAKEIFNLIRGANPWPGTFTFYNHELLKIHRAEMISENFLGTAGKIHLVSEKGIQVETPLGLLSLTEIQKPNKKKMSVAEFIKGYSIIRESFFQTQIGMI